MLQLYMLGILVSGSIIQYMALVGAVDELTRASFLRLSSATEVVE